MLPTELMAAIAAEGGGKVALVVGAGCSFDAPRRQAYYSFYFFRRMI